MANFCLALGLYMLSGPVIGSEDLKEISRPLPDTDISRWRWPYIHEAKIPIPIETTTITTPKYVYWHSVAHQEPTPKTRHTKRRKKRKRKKKGDKKIRRLSATGVPTEIRPPPGHQINYDSHISNEARVHVVIHPKDGGPRRTYKHPDDPVFSASATMMDFDEDPSLYLRIRDDSNTKLEKAPPPYGILPLSHIEEDFPSLTQKAKRRRRKDKRNRKRPRDGDHNHKKRRDKQKRTVNVRIPVRALIYNDTAISLQGRGRHLPRRLSPLKYPMQQPHQLVSLHSPTRIFVPVWENGYSNGTSSGKPLQCIRCPTNATLIAKRGSDSVVLTVPPVAVCPSLARRPGTLNLAVTSGPRPGIRLFPGEYPVTLIAWKSGTHVSSCKYTVFVKVRTCPKLQERKGLLMECQNGAIWGSVCKFTCSSTKDVLQGIRMMSCEENGDGIVDWTAPMPACGKGVTIPHISDQPVVAPLIKQSCKDPSSLTDGAVVCGTIKVNNLYPDQTICQYFCYPGFEMTFPQTHNSLMVCEDGVWSPNNNLQCTVDHCLQPNVLDKSGVLFNCGENKGRLLNGRTTYSNGTSCQFQCQEGFLMLVDQQTSVTCLAPNWNMSTVPDCMRAVPPAPHKEDCRDMDFIVDPGVGLIFGVDLAPPRFVSPVKSELLTPTCTLSAKKHLKRGLHMNDCKVEDPWTGLSAACTYNVVIRERIPPKPAPRHCSDKIIYTTQSGTAFIQVPKFYASSPETQYGGAKALPVTCTYSGDVDPGTYVNLCSSYDPVLNVTGNCTYSIKVKARSCPPLKQIPNGKLTCDYQKQTIADDTYPPDTVCEYACAEGYIIPKKFHKRRTRICHTTLKWSISVYPFCKKAMAPQLLTEDCQHRVLFVEDNDASLHLTLPRLKTSDRSENAEVRCSLNGTLSVGNYTNICEAVDTESRLSSTCTYNITIRARTCTSLGAVEYADVVCSVKEIDEGHPISSICSYICHADYVIPTSKLSHSTKMCMDDEHWNSTVLPSCIRKIIPLPNNSSCQDTVIETNDVWNVMLPSPVFLTTNGHPISTTCSPIIIEDFGMFNVSCNAHDTELRTSNSCNYTITVLPLPDDTTALPPQDKSPVAVEPGCVDHQMQIKVGDHVPIIYPEFKTFRNTSADVTCSPLNMTDANLTQTVTCHAIDKETNLSTSCDFNVTLHYMQTEMPHVEQTTLTPRKDCSPLIAPVNGYLSCKSPYSCEISCSEGLGFSPLYPILREGLVTCDETNGTWDFQREYDIETPDCLREFSTTSAEVWLKFIGAVEQCGEPEITKLQTKIKDELLQMNYNICRTINCTNSFEFSCTHDDERNRLALVTQWTIRASFDPEDYEDSPDVPLVETQVEQILETTRKAVKTENDFQKQLLETGMELFENSFSRSRFVLVCDERGYMLDSGSDKCVACPPHTMEVNRQCEPCPENYYQSKTGQTACQPCLEGYGDLPGDCLWDDFVQ